MVTGSRVVIVQQRYGGDVPNFRALYRYTSMDRGATFGAGEVMAYGLQTEWTETVAGPGDTISGVTSLRGSYINVPLSGAAGDPNAFAALGGDHQYNGTVAQLDPTTPLVIYQTGGGATRFRRYDGSGPLNTDTNWTAPVDIGTMSSPKLAGGPKGVFLLATTTGYPYSLFARKWNGTTFGAPVTVADGIEAPLHAFQDAGGRLHVAVSRGRGPFNLLHGVSDDGVTWRVGTVVTQSAPADGNIGDTRIAVAPDRIGVVAWWAGTGSGEIRVAAVGPDAPVDAPPPPPPLPLLLPPPPPPPLKIAAPLPSPVLGKFVNVVAVRGSVRVKVPGAGFVALTTARQLPVGTVFDTTRGVVDLTSATARRGKVQSGEFGAGRFKVSQKPDEQGLTELALVVSKSERAGCPRPRRARARAAAKRKLPRSVLSRLRADATGRFRTRGRHSAATVRGTKWTTTDRCDGTLTQVQSGVVVVNDRRRGKNIVLRAGKSYLARAR